MTYWTFCNNIFAVRKCSEINRFKWKDHLGADRISKLPDIRPILWCDPGYCRSSQKLISSAKYEKI